MLPAIAGVVAGILIGVSPGAYYGYGAFVAVLTVVGGFEHQDGWGGADRGVVGGFIYGVVLLVTHAIVGTKANVSLGSHRRSWRHHRDHRDAAGRARRLVARG